MISLFATSEMEKPKASSESALQRMRSMRQRDTDAEIRLRIQLRKLSLGYRVAYRISHDPQKRRHRVCRAQGRGIRGRLFLAWLSDTWHVAQGERRVVAAETRSERCSRPRYREHAHINRMAGVSSLGAPEHASSCE